MHFMAPSDSLSPNKGIVHLDSTLCIHRKQMVLSMQKFYDALHWILKSDVQCLLNSYLSFIFDWWLSPHSFPLRDYWINGWSLASSFLWDARPNIGNMLYGGRRCEKCDEHHLQKCSSNGDVAKLLYGNSHTENIVCNIICLFLWNI